MRRRLSALVLAASMVGPAGCASESVPPSTTQDASTTAQEVTSTTEEQETVTSTTALGQPRDIWEEPLLGPIPAGTYFIDPDLDPSTSLRVVYDIPNEGWSQWVGGFKPSDVGHVGVSITTVDNVVTDACLDHNHANPPVGPTVDDLADALASLSPFVVTSQPEDVTIYGYSGKHLELTVPDMAVERSGDRLRFTECSRGELRSWVAPFDTPPDDAFYGYTGPGYTEEFWILDVGGTRLMIAAERSSGSPEEDVAEQLDILASIRIEP